MTRLKQTFHLKKFEIIKILIILYEKIYDLILIKMVI